MFRKNEVVYAQAYGKGIVISTDDVYDYSGGYPLIVRFDDRKQSYTSDGRFLIDDLFPSLSIEPIASAVLPTSFKRGDWVVFTPSSTSKYYVEEMEGQKNRILKVVRVDEKDESVLLSPGYWTEFSTIKLATEDEIPCGCK